MIFLTISELNKFIKDVINSGFPQTLWICGEIQQYNRNKTKRHIFFELVEKDKASKDIKGRIGLVIFAAVKQQIENTLKRNANAFELKDDIEVKFACKVDFYAPHGAVRLIVEAIDPTYTLGKLAQEKQKLIQLLKDKGALEKNKSLPLPLVPLRIGLITSFDSAAYNDFCHELISSGLGFQIFVRNALVQGKGAEKDVANALKQFNRNADKLDVVIITRGGGSVADLSCFDSQLIAETIASSSIPVLTGIGHEIDLSVTDLAAHTYDKTPTAIARFCVQRVQNFLDEIKDRGGYLLQIAQEQLDSERSRLRDQTLHLQSGTQQFLGKHRNYVLKCQEFLRHRPLLSLRESKTDLKNHHQRLQMSTNRRVQQSFVVIRQLQEGIEKCSFNALQKNRARMQGFQKMIDIANPVNTIKRGFTITRNSDGKALKSLKNITEGETVVTELVDGSFESQVTASQS